MAQDSADAMSLSASAARPVTARRRPHLTGLGDQIILGSFTLAAWVVLLLVVALFVTLVIAAWPAIKTVGVTPLQSATWDPNSGKFGVLSFIYGTIVTSAIALLLAGPIGI